MRQTCIQIAKENVKAQGKVPNDEKAAAWFEGLKNERFATDVFA